MSDQIVQQIPSWTYWLPPVSVLAGVLITSIVNYINNKSTKVTEEKKTSKRAIIKDFR